jgi:hypothetical protein
MVEEKENGCKKTVKLDWYTHCRSGGEKKGGDTRLWWCK